MATRQEMFAALKKRAEQGDPEAMLELATTLGRSDPESINWLQRAADAGHPKAFSSLGWAYEKGFHGAPVDLALAVDFYSKAIAAGVNEMGPLALPKHVKSLKTKLKAAAKGGDPLDALFKEAKLGKQQQAILDSSRPSIRWIAKESKADLATGASKLGGAPDVPAGFKWPQTESGRPLEFLASLDFDSAPKIDGVPAVTGRLLFFYDAEEMPWGDPGETGWAVIHVPPGAKLERAKAPKGVERYPVSSLTPTVEKTIPMFRTRAFRALGLSDKAAEAYWKLLEEWPAAEGESFRSFGHEDAIQGDMPRRLVYAEADADLDKENPKLEAAAAEFLLLFQMDSYEHGDVMWGDDGKLFFWITRADLEAGRFEKVRLQLQCH